MSANRERQAQAFRRKSIRTWVDRELERVVGLPASPPALQDVLSPREIKLVLAKRKAAWRMPPYKSTRGTLAKYIRLVKNAALGCVTDEE